MIMNKNQFKKAINDRELNIEIKRVYNLDKENKVKEGSIGYISYVQSNACRVKYDTLDNELWIYLDDVDIKDGKMYYYSYIPENRREEAIERANELGIELIPVEDDDKINKDYIKGRSNYKYVYKYVIVINEIMGV